MNWGAREPIPSGQIYSAFGKRISIFFIKKFLLNLLEDGVAVIFVDLEEQTIFVVGEDEVNNGDLVDALLKHYSDATLFAREYDHIYDY